MILKLHINSRQLTTLHECLDGPSNRWDKHWHRDKGPEKMSYAWIKSVKGGGSKNEPVPSYEVVLEVETHYLSLEHGNKIVPTPLERLTHILHAVGLFPVEDGQFT